MCGIAGIIKLNKTKIDIKTIKNMTNIIQHRGPDAEGIWLNSDKTIGFGHRRLSIIAIGNDGAQPMNYFDNRYTITYNGEIYNYLEIKEILLIKGVFFNTNSDTEVILASYHIYKEKCLDLFDGMFSFVIYDSLENKVFCARDRFGEKPFHYCIYENSFYFGSEIKQFWAAGIPKIIDDVKITSFIETGFLESKISKEKTFYKNVLRLDAAHYISLNLDSPKISPVKYWDIDLNKPKYSGNFEDATKIFYSLLHESVKLRLRSDVQLGSSLSGGLDSSTIVSLINLISENAPNQNTFSARFKDYDKDEGYYIKQILDSCKNLTDYNVWPDSNYFNDVFEKVIYYQDEPFGSSSSVAQYAVMELAKSKGVKVLLDGQGADEYLAGYPGYYEQYLNQLYHSSKHNYYKELKKYNQLHNSNIRNFSETMTLRMKCGLFKKKILNQTMPFNNKLSEMLYYDTMNNGLKDLLRFADRNSMAHSVEVRLPFLSHKLVEFVFGLPDNYKLSDGWSKYILRNSMQQYLPDKITWRVDKIGYEPPQQSWLSHPLWQQEISNSYKYFQVEKEINNQNKGIIDKDWRVLISHKYCT
jgi:asparagine synthase (glutamine-hydrolysing)